MFEMNHRTGKRMMAMLLVITMLLSMPGDYASGWFTASAEEIPESGDSFNSEEGAVNAQSETAEADEAEEAPPASAETGKAEETPAVSAKSGKADKPAEIVEMGEVIKQGDAAEADDGEEVLPASAESGKAEGSLYLVVDSSIICSTSLQTRLFPNVRR